jgi:FdhD protein
MTELATTAIKSAVSVHHMGEQVQYVMDDIAVEVPIALVYNYISHAVMMATPDNLEEFAIGFSITEGIVNNRDDIEHIHIHHGEKGITVRLQINDDCYESLKEVRRNIVGRTGCGLCGTEQLNQAIKPVKPVKAPDLTDDIIQKAVQNLRKKQALQILTGATHAVGWSDLQGNIQFVREDVGRHNALDKVIGLLANDAIDTKNGFVVITSRASYEMIQKATQVGIGAVVAISAPTSLAINMAQQSGLLLVGFARSERHVIYNDPKQTEITQINE